MDTTLGIKPSSAIATPERGAKKEDATLIPPIEISVPAVTIAFAKGPMNTKAASATGVLDVTRESPMMPIQMAWIKIYTIDTKVNTRIIAFGTLRSGFSISSAATAMDSKPVKA